eukprot:CAMPEP_0178439348 /NCGR_PEP_ID=MMETSP0689_2-20121128/36107_1 /TAXON_ID=160604 /ORGANISM="Amphidinium massartii, Strain CS-259" /LENGTH=156 /DNA_ID=CAMNT_0020061869 /DNA_START=31 /DNA_END=501 /DNA_ORIENTATION=+
MTSAVGGASEGSSAESDERMQLAPAQPSAMQPAASSSQVNWLREMIREETASAVSSLQSQARPMQLIINNHAQANADQRTMNVQPSQPEGYRRDDLRSGIMSFLASPLNRIFLFSTVGLSLYALQGHLSHKWRMEEMQRKMDANILFRFRHLLLSS